MLTNRRYALPPSWVSDAVFCFGIESCRISGKINEQPLTYVIAMFSVGYGTGPRPRPRTHGRNTAYGSKRKKVPG